MGLLIPEIKIGGLVRVLSNPNGWSEIEIGGVYRVHSTSKTMFTISTREFPAGAYFMMEWGEAVWD